MKRLSFAALLSVLVVAGCASTGPSASNSEKIPVAASVYPLAFLAERIGGEHVYVTQIVPAGVEPHDYEPQAQRIAAVYDARVFLLNGAGLDPWAEKLKDELSGKQITVTVAEHVALLEGDPHVWLDPVTMENEAELVRDALIGADPVNTDFYDKNAAGLIAGLDALHTEFSQGLSDCALRRIVVSHDAFRYLAKRYGYETLALAGLSPEEEPAPQKMAEIAEIARQQGIRHIFFETLVSPKLAETIANEIGAEPLVLNPVEGLTAKDIATGKDYFSLMRENLQNLHTAMQCR